MYGVSRCTGVGLVTGFAGSQNKRRISTKCKQFASLAKTPLCMRTPFKVKVFVSGMSSSEPPL